MNQKLSIIYKIHLFIITITALDIYQNKSINIILEHLLKSKNLVQNNQTDYIFDKLYIIKIIYNISYIMRSNIIQEPTKTIIQQYTNKIYGNMLNQYIKKFTYIYYKNYDYYKNSSFNKQINIKDIAITNLYIINQINNKFGLYIIFKYLYL